MLNPSQDVRCKRCLCTTGPAFHLSEAIGDRGLSLPLVNAWPPNRGEPLQRKPAVYKLSISEGWLGISQPPPPQSTTTHKILHTFPPMDAFQIISTVASSFSTTKSTETEEIFRDAEDGSGQSGYCVIA
ncbi:hypothetical protein FRB94_012841 [Tulasnella sp. JGI-2019a]|nr:hypothetical protein FRB94_012841 [Tulasnella sp. JGI-2019a]KAG9016389.1 hypothetical protein FRB93_010638 [Tulasnella sp. JGI-2019a]KAG9028400.1 hypothetical protein FRB95_006531 [Tulasnella sp. JGI-2019a]